MNSSETGKELTARIHSFESFGTLDGPGIRFVIFFQGCPLHCLYCHNPDSLCSTGGRIMKLEELFDTIRKYRSFISGGVTLSGGEPLAQAPFCEALLTRCKQNKIHTAIDTSGAIPLSRSARSLELADLILLDIKAMDPELCKKITGQDNRGALETLAYTRKIGKPVWIRHVLVPGLTLIESQLEEMADYLTAYRNIEKVELLPFHKMGEYKWEELGMQYELTDTPEPTEREVEAAREIFRRRGLPL